MHHDFMRQGGRMANVGRARERRSTEGQGLLRKEGPPTYAILLRNLVLSRFTRFLKGFRRAPNESHPAFIKLSTKHHQDVDHYKLPGSPGYVFTREFANTLSTKALSDFATLHESQPTPAWLLLALQGCIS